MTDIEQKALALVNEVRVARGFGALENSQFDPVYYSSHGAICRAIERHEAFRQEVSDAAKEYAEAAYCMGWEGFDRFIIPKPKPDPLFDVLLELGLSSDPNEGRNDAKEILAALEARGLTITTLEKD